MPVLASAHSSNDGTGCCVRRDTGDWQAAGAAPGVQKEKKVGTSKMPVGRRRSLAHEVHAVLTERQKRTKRKNKPKISGGILKGGQPPLSKFLLLFPYGKSRTPSPAGGGHLTFIWNLKDIPFIGVDNRGFTPLQRTGPLGPIVEMHMPMNEILWLVFV